MNDLPTLARVVHEMIEDYEKQNCCYLELRSTPKCFGDKTKIDYVNTILNIIDKAEKELPEMKVRYILSINRTGSVQEAEELLTILEEIKSPYIVGVELSGNCFNSKLKILSFLGDPRGGDWTKFKDVLEKVRSQFGKKISLHCAEVEEQKHESQGMIDFNPDRLGHCIYLTKE